jgi:hypothetical protein
MDRRSLLDRLWKGDPRKQLLTHLVNERERGAPVVGGHCDPAEAPLEMARGG